MKEHGAYRIPSIGSLIAFESAARHGNFSKAASDLQTSQPAVSLHIARLENQLSARLFDRTRSGVILTDAGRRFLEGVVAGLEVIHAAAEEAGDLSPSNQVVIACAHDSSHLVLFPRYDALWDAVGRDNQLRLLTYQRFPKDPPYDPAADIVLTWNAPNGLSDAAEEDWTLVFDEEVQIVCSPEFAEAHADILDAPVADRAGLTHLNLSVPNHGWATWQDWFEVAGYPTATPVYQGFDSYTQVLEAAAGGLGIALGFRGYIERYLEAGEIVMLKDEFVRFDGRYVAMLTAKGRRSPLARGALSFFAQWTQRPLSTGG